MSTKLPIDEAALPPTTGSRLFRSAVSGLWYYNARAAGSIDAVEINGQRIIRNEGERSIYWIHRVGEWASKIHSENAQCPATERSDVGSD